MMVSDSWPYDGSFEVSSKALLNGTDNSNDGKLSLSLSLFRESASAVSGMVDLISRIQKRRMPTPSQEGKMAKSSSLAICRPEWFFRLLLQETLAEVA